MLRFWIMIIFFGAIFVVGLQADRLITKNIKNDWLFYLIFALAVLVNGFGIILVHQVLLKYIMTFLLAISLLILYLRLNRVFKHKLEIMEQHGNVKR